MRRESFRTDGRIDRNQTDWYKDAIIYQLHVKAFQDANGDGMGDFAGLMRRLDYVQDLGVNTLWLLPFYPSPLRDDGYDIADYRSINPSYGSMRDFRAFVAEAHRRGMRVITELVINHTSDQHPWFQRARRARPGSAARDFYVWSDTDQKYLNTRIIFLDTETSNWTWDPVAGAFYWHRFYSHQPDLNFDNPRVLKEVLKVMHFWLEMGVDGLRLDAIPYLIERDGTNNENLPETHEILKKIRAELDSRYSDRMLLAEANQWPEDTRPYFGEGDECHMGFHFPLMPRMYMALAREDRHPITDIIRQTPEIPANCQWGIFLRNHDELTLEMVTASERDYLWSTYASDSRARINLGIRRRLAPLMQNDRRKIELLNSLLMSMPGTPIVYYGDELGMGDNYYLGDRDGVRTPMQWSSDLNAGFSRADPQRLYLPVILDPVYGYQAVNAESQIADPHSLLIWMRRLIAVRKQHRAFGRGSMQLLYPANRKILAYVREHDGETILCVANLSRSAQAVELDLSAWKGAVPLELTGRSPFPPVGDLPYLVTLPAWGFFWFRLATEAEAPSWHQPVPEMLPEFLTLTTRDGRVSSAIAGREGEEFQRDALPRFVRIQRWFAAKDREIASARLVPLAELDDGRHLLAACEVKAGDASHRYFLPLSAKWGEEHVAFGAPTLSWTLAKVRRGPRMGALVDATADEGFASDMLVNLRDGTELPAADGTIVFAPEAGLAAIEDPGQPRPMSADQSNASIRFGDSVILKIYRRLRKGPQPEVEMVRFLSGAGFEHMPPFLGRIGHVDSDGVETTLATAFGYVRNQGDAWQFVIAALMREFEDLPVQGEDAPFTPELADIAGRLGAVTGDMHVRLASASGDPAFDVAALSPAQIRRWTDETLAETDELAARLSASSGRLDAGAAALAGQFADGRSRLQERLKRLSLQRPSGGLSRIHGDYHLGQVLVDRERLYVIDFEGEPRRSIDMRRARNSPLVDVAGMLRSFDYVAANALRNWSQLSPADVPAATRRVDRWRRHAAAEFGRAWFAAVEGSATAPQSPAEAEALLDLFLIRKAIYETGYELANRPAWMEIPLAALVERLSEG